MCNKATKIAELFTKTMATTRCFDQNLRKVKVVSCSDGRMLTEFQVGPEHLNQRGTLHGGFIAHLVDAISTYALTANDKVETRGVSIDLSVSYLTAAREGDNVEVEAITRKVGKKIAFLEVEVRNKESKTVLATDLLEQWVANVLVYRNIAFRIPFGPFKEMKSEEASSFGARQQTIPIYRTAYKWLDIGFSQFPVWEKPMSSSLWPVYNYFHWLLRRSTKPALVHHSADVSK